MGKQVIVAKNMKSGQKMLFSTVEEAAQTLGVSPATVSRSTGCGAECEGYVMRRVDPVLAVRLKASNTWRIVQEVQRTSGYIEYGNPVSRIRKSEVAEVKDVTLSWYMAQ